MKKKNSIVYIFLLISFLSSPLLLDAETDAEIQAKIEDVKRQREQLLEEQRKLQASLDETSKQGTTLQTNVKSLDVTRAKLANDLKITQTNINSANLTIQKLEKDIGKNETEISNHEVAIKSLLKKLASYDRSSIVIDVLTHKNLNEVWADTVNIWNVEDSLILRIDSLRNTQVSLLKNKVAKETQKTKLVGLSSQLKGQKTVADDTRSAQVLLLAATKSKEAEYQKLLAENRAREAEFEKLLFQFESQLKASDPNLRPTGGKGSLSWPLDTVFITQQFGKTSASGRLYSSGTHNGTDFRASVGTPIKSVGAGIVTGVGNTDDQKGCYSYGRWILIRHGNGVSSLYAHLSGSIVSKDQVVAEGETIGYSGGQPGQKGSGFSTGPHLHLGLFVTAGVQIRAYSTSQNCKNVSVPLANPSDYIDPLAYLPNL